MSSSLFPEKFALYFSTMNSLSAKIYSDVQEVEESLSSKSLTYNEKCAVVDKCLIHDIVHKSKDPNSDILEEQEVTENAHFNDPCLDQTQTTSLLLSVFPKKPEKYIFEENGFWLDEHSQPFSYAKQSQTNYCALGDLVRKLPAEARHSLLVEGKEEKMTIRRSQRESKKLNRKLSEDDLIEDNVSTEKKDVKKKPKSKAPFFFGVNVMGATGGSQTEQIRRSTEPEVAPQSDVEEEESKLPKQKQNLELIAELQAKLNKNKTSVRAPIEIQPTAQVQPPVTPLVKLNKPKAPPPPPPKTLPGKAFKVTSPTSVPVAASVQKEPVLAESKANSKSKATESNETKVKTKPCEQPTPTSGNVKQEKEEFLVDVSSPCRIATPKTGFDFLDNW